jgi:GNAT superfamily N-acetyltransferase
MLLDVTIRKARIKDRDEILVLFKEFMRYNMKVATFKIDFVKGYIPLWLKFYDTHVRSRTKLALVAEHDGKLVGYLIGGIQKRPPIFKHKYSGFVSDLAVTESKRNKGVGTKLLKTFGKWAKSKGAWYVQLNVLPRNKDGIIFYGKNDYDTWLLDMRKVL